MGESIYPAPGTVLSTQEVSITIPNSSTSEDATISAIGDNYEIDWLGQTVSSAQAGGDFDVCRLSKIDSTTIRATRGRSSTNATTVNFIVRDKAV